MKALSYIIVLVALVSASCSSSLYSGKVNDDLYYSAADQNDAARNSYVADNPVIEKNLKVHQE